MRGDLPFEAPSRPAEPPKVVQLHGGRPSLNDVPGRLRVLADQIEAGEHGEIYSALVLLPQRNDYPIVFGFGSVDGQNDPIVTCELAKSLFVNNIVRRVVSSPGDGAA